MRYFLSSSLVLFLVVLRFLDEIGFHLWAGEARQGTVGVRGRPEDLLEPGVSGLLQQILTEGDPMTLGSCTPGSQRRGTCASCSWTSSSSATSS